MLKKILQRLIDVEWIFKLHRELMEQWFLHSQIWNTLLIPISQRSKINLFRKWAGASWTRHPTCCTAWERSARSVSFEFDLWSSVDHFSLQIDFVCIKSASIYIPRIMSHVECLKHIFPSIYFVFTRSLASHWPFALGDVHPDCVVWSLISPLLSRRWQSVLAVVVHADSRSTGRRRQVPQRPQDKGSELDLWSLIFRNFTAVEAFEDDFQRFFILLFFSALLVTDRHSL